MFSDRPGGGINNPCPVRSTASVSYTCRSTRVGLASGRPDQRPRRMQLVRAGRARAAPSLHGGTWKPVAPGGSLRQSLRRLDRPGAASRPAGCNPEPLPSARTLLEFRLACGAMPSASQVAEHPGSWPNASSRRSPATVLGPSWNTPPDSWFRLAKIPPNSKIASAASRPNEPML